MAVVAEDVATEDVGGGAAVVAEAVLAVVVDAGGEVVKVGVGVSCCGATTPTTSTPAITAPTASTLPPRWREKYQQ